MHVTYVGPVPPIRGGISQHGGNVVAALRRAGHRVEVISWSEQYPRALFKGKQVDVSQAASEDTTFPLAWWNPITLIQAGRVAAGSDLLLFPWVTAFHAPHLLTILTTAGRTPRVALVHNPLPHEPQPFDKQLTRVVLARVDGVVVHSERIAAALRELADVKRAVVVPHPPNLELEPTPQPPLPPMRLLSVGFVRPYKGVDIAIEAVRQLVERGEDVELTIAGDFWEPVEPWHERVREAGLTERVHFRPGYVADEDMAALFAEHHALILPYRSASQSGVAPIAFGAGRPVIATDVGALSDQVREGVSGAIARPEDPASVAEAVLRVRADLEGLSRGARGEVTPWSAVADAVLEAAGRG